MKLRQSKRVTPETEDLDTKRITRSAFRTMEKNSRESHLQSGFVRLKRLRQRSFAERNKQAGHSSNRGLTKKRIATIKKFIRTTAENASTEEDSEVYGSERWMDNLITILDPKGLFDLIYADIKRWLRMNPVFEETRRNPLSKKKSPVSSTDSESENTTATVAMDEAEGSSSSSSRNENGNKRRARELNYLYTYPDLSVPSVSLKKLRIPATPPTSSGSFTTQTPTQTNGGEEEENQDHDQEVEILDPLVVPAAVPLSEFERGDELSDGRQEESPQVTHEEAARMRQDFYPVIKKKLDEMLTMNLSIPPGDPSHISDQVLRPVLFMIECLAKPGVSTEELRANLFHASTFVTKQVVTSGPVVFGPDENHTSLSEQ